MENDEGRVDDNVDNPDPPDVNDDPPVLAAENADPISLRATLCPHCNGFGYRVRYELDPAEYPMGGEWDPTEVAPVSEAREICSHCQGVGAAVFTWTFVATVDQNSLHSIASEGCDVLIAHFKQRYMIELGQFLVEQLSEDGIAPLTVLKVMPLEVAQAAEGRPHLTEITGIVVLTSVQVSGLAAGWDQS